MREYGQLQASYYTHPDIQALPDACKLFGIYLLTGPHSNGLGCYRLPDGYIMADLGWSLDAITEAFAELAEVRFAYRCARTQYVFVPKFLRWNPIGNANVARAREREFESVPKQCEHYPALAQAMLTHGNHWRCPFAQRLAATADRNPCETLSKPFGKEQNNPSESPETTLADGIQRGFRNKIRSDPTRSDPILPSPDGDGRPSAPSGAKAPRPNESCPYPDIVALYHERLPDAPRVMSLSAQRKAAIRARWANEFGRSLEKLGLYFERVAASQFLTGRVNGAGRTPFRADLEWLMRPANVLRVVEGRYDDEGER